MKRSIVIASTLLAGFGAGAALGHLLRPAPPPVMEGGPECIEGDPCPDPAPASEAVTEETGSYDFVALDGQFVVPVLGAERVRALVVLSLTIEADPGAVSGIEALQPALRDALLQVLFNHAQAGGFEGAFTTGAPMRDLRAALQRRAAEIAGAGVRGVLVTDIVKQDL
ncbi:MAG: flagellar basal body-associated FliL family protein [Rubricella sp.]